MQIQTSYFILFIILSVVIVAIFWFAISSSKNPDPDWKVKMSYKFRGKFLIGFSAIVVFMLAFTLSMLPYPTKNQTPDRVVPVDAQMYAFTLHTEDGQPVLPVDQLIEFRVTSKDVNHGFAIYAPSGDVVTQVQAMPGYVNRLRVTFTEPGEYQVLCLEYCGPAHHVMRTTFTVN